MAARHSISQPGPAGWRGSISPPGPDVQPDARRRRGSIAQRTLVVVALVCATAVAGALGLQATLLSGTAAQAEPDQNPFRQPGLLDSTTASPGTSPTISTTAQTSPTGAPAPTTTTAAPRPPAPPPATAASLPEVAQQLLVQINGWRAEVGQPPLTMTAGLVASGHKHNLRMSAGCGLSHQCSGEAVFSARISAEGIQWNACAENIAYSSGVSSSTSAILAAAQRQNVAMHNEQPPNDGHRRNMLGAAYHRIGIDVIRDASGKVWMTQDFAS